VLAGLEQGPQRLEKLLDQEAARLPEPGQRRLAASLVYAVLRHRLLLDHHLAGAVSRPLAGLDAPVLAVLRLGAAELLLLSTPDHAALHQAVELAKATPARRAAGLVNAALRSLARRRSELAPPAGRDAAALSVRYSHPRWLVEELLAQWPAPEVEAWLAADQQEPPLGLRANTLRATPGELAEALAASGVAARPHALAPECLVVEGHRGPARELAGFARGLWQAQDPGAAAVGRLVGVEPGMRVLDLCAGAGGKTGHLAALLKGDGELVAVEPSAGRFRALEANLARLGAPARLVRADGRQLPAGLGRFHRVLVDAPCTGLGVAGRRPDVRWRRGPEDPARLAGLQAELLAAGARLLEPGGAVLYCTCTVTRAENQEVVAAALAAVPGLAPAWDREAAGPAAAAIVEDGFFHSLPHRHGSDAFFAARLARAA
jgi:16S rRNA (cytosine967-C5)-methyltransferase